jgi:hypothetical protein
MSFLLFLQIRPGREIEETLNTLLARNGQRLGKERTFEHLHHLSRQPWVRNTSPVLSIAGGSPSGSAVPVDAIRSSSANIVRAIGLGDGILQLVAVFTLEGSMWGFLVGGSTRCIVIGFLARALLTGRDCL